MTEQIRNGYDDGDLRKIVEEIEGYEDEKASARAEAAGKCSAIAKRIANAKKTAKALNIPTAALNALLKTRALERKLDAVAKDVPEDLVEVFDDMTGQFSFFAPVDGEEPSDEPPGKKAAKRAAAEAKAHHEAEQAEGEAALNELAQVH